MQESTMGVGPTGHDARCVADVRLVVVGAGPTGMAALLAARAHGIEAIGIDAGGGTLGAVREYPNGLIFTSPAHHYEIGGLPLDCRDPSELTREELLSYYARVATVGQLRVEPNTTLVGLKRRKDRWVLDVLSPSGSAHLRAEAILFTNWFRRRRAPDALRDPEGKTVTVEVLREVSEVAGRSVAIVGGGLSAVEHATRLMTLGTPVTVVARHDVSTWLQDPAVARLSRATRSRWFGEADQLRVSGGCLSFDAREQRCRVRCDILVTCLGMELDPAMMRLSREVGLLRQEDAARLETAQTFDVLRRRFPALSLDEIADRAVAQWPDLSHALAGAARGLSVAGGVLHAGGPHAGVMVSTRTAELAVSALAGSPAFAPLEGEPLPRTLFEWSRDRLATPPSFTSVRTLRPLAIGSFSRGVRLGRTERAGGGSLENTPTSERSDPTRFVTNVLRTRPQTARFIGVATGERTLEELAAMLGCQNDSDRDTLAASFYWLCRSNALTWLPDSSGSAAWA